MAQYDFKMLRTNTCWCCNLSSGARVTGFLGIIFNIAILTYASTTVLKIPYLEESAADIFQKIIMMCSAMELWTHLLLLYGVIKKKAVMLLPWMVFKMIIILIALVLFYVYGLQLGFSRTPIVRVVFFFAGATIGVVFIWIWMCIYSLYLQLHEENQKVIQGEFGFVTESSDLIESANYC